MLYSSRVMLSPLFFVRSCHRRIFAAPSRPREQGDGDSPWSGEGFDLVYTWRRSEPHLCSHAEGGFNTLSHDFNHLQSFEVVGFRFARPHARLARRALLELWVAVWLSSWSSEAPR